MKYSDDFVQMVLVTTVEKQFALASYALAVYEYIITFDREVETKWKRRLKPAMLLWYFNRYVLHLSFIPTILMFFIPLSTTLYRCINFVKYPGAMQILLNASTGATLTILVSSMYFKSRWILALLIAALVVELAVEAWALMIGAPASLPPGIPGCILSGNSSKGNRFTGFWIGQLFFPTIIFFLAIVQAIRLNFESPIRNGFISTLLRDGAMYFFVIFVANLANVLMYPLASEDLKFINAPFTNVITSLMICRLMLNLNRGRETYPPSTPLLTISYGACTSTPTEDISESRSSFADVLRLSDLDQDPDIDCNEQDREREEQERIRRIHTPSHSDGLEGM